MPVAISPGEYAAQRGYGIHKWVDAKSASGAEQVLTDTTLYYNLSVGEVVMINRMTFDLVTVSRDCVFELVSCADVAGGGVATQLCIKTHIHTGANREESASQEHVYDPPVRVTYASGARSISARITASAAQAIISVGWQGYTDLSL